MSIQAVNDVGKIIGCTAAITKHAGLGIIKLGSKATKKVASTRSKRVSSIKKHNDENKKVVATVQNPVNKGFDNTDAMSVLNSIL